MTALIKSVIFFFVLLNPFLIIVYLVDVIKKKPLHTYGRILLRAGIISYIVFALFSILGDALFAKLMNASFASFQVFGGIIFLLIGIQFIFRGGAAIKSLRGESKHIAGAIAMPIFIGPGTISYSVIIGQRHTKPMALLAIAITVLLCMLILYLLKLGFDRIQARKEELVEQYFEIAGRVTALIIGTISIEMIMQGLSSWIERL